MAASNSCQQYLIPAPDQKMTKKHHYHYVALYSLWNYFVAFCEREQTEAVSQQHQTDEPQEVLPVTFVSEATGDRVCVSADPCHTTGTADGADVSAGARGTYKNRSSMQQAQQATQTQLDPAARMNEYSHRPRLHVFVNLAMTKN